MPYNYSNERLRCRKRKYILILTNYMIYLYNIHKVSTSGDCGIKNKGKFDYLTYINSLGFI